MFGGGVRVREFLSSEIPCPGEIRQGPGKGFLSSEIQWIANNGHIRPPVNRQTPLNTFPSSNFIGER